MPIVLLLLGLVMYALTACNNKKNTALALFEAIEAKETGLLFSNNLVARENFNMFKYMYFYNGAGVAAGDYNNDGLIDLFFSSNQGQNKLYLNKGNLTFIDITIAAQIPKDSAWSTGVSVVDINNDGLLDLYVCRVGNYEQLQSSNQFLVCQGISKNGIPTYKDMASSMGLAVSAFSTQAAFFDYDADGDLDMYLMNHSLRYNGTFNDRQTYTNTTDSLAGDVLYNNDKGKFTNVSKQAGISGTIISYGLGICAADINMDGYIDIYVANDFHENDYLYINQKNGTFKETMQAQTMHSSQFSMGVDVADINNDALPDIISMDMLPYEPKILKRSLEDDDYNLFNYKVKAGYEPQFSRNALQINRGNGMFSEVAMYAGVEATDWSWAALFIDFDNNGWKDLFVSNGIPKRLNDMDYVNYVTNSDIQDKIRANKMDEKEMGLINKFPEIKLPNQFFVNKRNVQFDNISSNIKNNIPSFSNGAAYADFDNDGDVDIVVNNIDATPLLYKNNSNDINKNNWFSLQLKGSPTNINAIGTKAIVYTKDSVCMYEKTAVRGFQSSMEAPLHIGLGTTIPDSILLIWPDNTYQPITYTKDTFTTVSYNMGLPKFNYSSLQKIKSNYTATDITATTSINLVHAENPFNEFDREQLMPHMVSREGPAIAVADVNNDGLDDLFVGAAKFVKPILYYQTKLGKFIPSAQISLDNDSTYEDVDANFADVNNDGFTDLLIASGGNEFFGNSAMLQPRVYLNNGKGVFVKKQNAFEANILLTASCIKPADFNGDGYIDLFIGGRAVPWEYAKTPHSYLLQNDGTGKFVNVTQAYHAELSSIGLVTNAAWADLDGDTLTDLIISLEWGEVIAFKNNKTNFTKKVLTDKLGWWTFVLPVDVNADGKIDLIAGNLGLNNRFKATLNTPLSLYYNDFDDNGKNEQFITYFVNNTEIPFANKDELTKQLPSLKKKFLYAETFTNSPLTDIVGEKKMETAQKLQANYFANSLFVNNGNWQFALQALPWQAQLSTLKTGVVLANKITNTPNIFLAGNFYPSNIKIGKYDADYGTILNNDGLGSFTASSVNNLLLKGEVRHIQPITIMGKTAYVVVKNNDSLKIITL